MVSGVENFITSFRRDRFWTPQEDDSQSIQGGRKRKNGVITSPRGGEEYSRMLVLENENDIGLYLEGARVQDATSTSSSDWWPFLNVVEHPFFVIVDK